MSTEQPIMKTAQITLLRMWDDLPIDEFITQLSEVKTTYPGTDHLVAFHRDDNSVSLVLLYKRLETPLEFSDRLINERLARHMVTVANNKRLLDELRDEFLEGKIDAQTYERRSKKIG